MSVDALRELLDGRSVCVLTGAGCSTESGIPDYRGPGTARRARNPIQFREFVGNPAWRARYWARSAVGWPRVQLARPNPAHLALAELGWPIVTQNVDGLHQAAGSREVVELHGSLAHVVCLGCRDRISRAAFQEALLARNPHLVGQTAELAPDGDAELVQGADHPACARCGGVLKPDVVFFGESVPRDRVDAAFDLVRSAEVLLVVGSSLTVFSGYRFVKRASEWGRRVAIVNLGPTRGDRLADLVVEGRAGEVLPALNFG
ncbi:MAG: NAD-dependent protein deacetylase [Myxococcota bacterium]